MHECGFSYQRAEKVYRSRASDIADFERPFEKGAKLIKEPRFAHKRGRNIRKCVF
jgi:hypothetical protein